MYGERRLPAAIQSGLCETVLPKDGLLLMMRRVSF